MEHILDLYTDGKIKPHIDEVFALEEVGKAMQRMHQRKNVGKIIISPMKEPTLEPTPQPPAEPAPTEEEDGKTEDKEGEEKTEDKEGEEKTGGEKEEPNAEEEKKEEAAA